MPEYYTPEAVQQILHLAIARQTESEEFSRVQLLEIAKELGIPPENIAHAEQEWLLNQGQVKERRSFDLYRQTKFKNNLVRYGIANSFLVVLNLLTAHTLTWTLPILFLWGLFLALKGWKTYQLTGEEYDKAFAAWRLKQQIGHTIHTTLNKWLKPQEGLL
ncbi:MAG TPA: 2TM domain-containing protein [Vampirovibrionales bacterium]